MDDIQISLLTLCTYIDSPVTNCSLMYLQIASILRDSSFVSDPCFLAMRRECVLLHFDTRPYLFSVLPFAADKIPNTCLT
jgi:hypothetical protein